MTTLLIARHGNTFDKDQVAVRIGSKTDLPLSGSGTKQAAKLGNYLHINHIRPAAAYCGNLIRTQETATLALAAAEISVQPIILSMFDEIDYGPDEGKTNEEIIARIGEIALHNWEQMAVAPPGWLVDIDKIVQNWREFANSMTVEHPNATVLVVTSNGIARFVPYLTGDFFGFTQHHKIKLATGSVGSITFKEGIWEIDYWNQVPK